MNLSLNYVSGANNTISICDKQNIYLGSITLNHFGMIAFEQERALTILEQQEIHYVCQRLQQVI